MTASTERRDPPGAARENAPPDGERPAAASGAPPPVAVFDARWRAERERVQEQAMPSGRVAVSCATRLGVGGLGRHLQEAIGALERRGASAVCICEDPADPVADGGPGRRVVQPRGPGRRLEQLLAPATRRSPTWSTWAASAAFDAGAARRLPDAEHLIAFNGHALAQLRAARRAGMRSVALMSATSHLRRVVRLHARAHAQYPLERSWAPRLLGRTLAEYALAGRIHVSSRHVWESFVQEGVPAESLALFPLTPDPRFVPDEPARRAAASFDVVYVGSLSVVKGVPLLIDAVRRLDCPELRLVLVGGWGTRGMRRFVQRACAADRRIVVRPGDPLPHLQRAAVCAHPSWEDGFGYAPVEALACGTPAIVTEQTGMQELIDPGRTGLVLPAGDGDALAQAIEAAYRGELLGG